MLQNIEIQDEDMRLIIEAAWKFYCIRNQVQSFDSDHDRDEDIALKNDLYTAIDNVVTATGINFDFSE